jgi:hypothetical protein
MRTIDTDDQEFYGIKEDKQTFCCDGMKFGSTRGWITIDTGETYSRTYFDGPGINFVIWYCPWCGKKVTF